MYLTMRTNKFELYDKNLPRKQQIFSVRMEEADIMKLQRMADKEGMNFHRFIKSILYGYINYSERAGATK
jgi:predicted DNA binding CopG/RHH family protein